MHFHLFHTVVPAITDTVLEKSDSERGMSVIVEHAQLCGFSVVAVCPQAQAFTMKKLQWLATGKSSSTLSCILKGVTKCPGRGSLIGLPGCQGQQLSDRLGNEGWEEDECHPRVCPTHVISPTK
ncbi:uncharacterized [Tachysurus ichikawai]